MDLNVATGIYRYLKDEKAAEFLRPGAFLHELKKGEFLIIDSVPRLGQPITQNVPRLFKFVFPNGIAEASKRIKPQYGEILDNFAYALRGEKAPEKRAEVAEPADDGGVAATLDEDTEILE